MCTENTLFVMYQKVKIKFVKVLSAKTSDDVESVHTCVYEKHFE